MIEFFVGLHQPSDARHFRRCCININRLRGRKSPVPVAAETEDGSGGFVLIDSGAFTELSRFGHYRHSVGEYAATLRSVAGLLPVAAAVSQDWMCEPFIVRKTDLSVAEHQKLTIDRYDALTDCDVPFPIMPVLQGFYPDDYARHVEAYGDRLRPGMWVGVGSVCKRNASPVDVANVLASIAAIRGDLRLHGFGLKLTALLDGQVRRLLATADSMAWSFAARRQGRNANDWREAHRFEQIVLGAAGRRPTEWQVPLPLTRAEEAAE